MLLLQYMKIAILTPTFPPYGGGIGMVAYHNAHQLTQFGHEVTVMTPQYRSSVKSKKEKTNDESFEVRLLSVVFENGNAAIVKKLLKELGGFDVVHLHYPFFGVAEILRLRLHTVKKRQQKFILHYHMDPLGTGWRKAIFNFSQRFILPGLCRQADRIIVTSMDYGNASAIAPWLHQYPEKSVAVPNGVSLDEFKPITDVGFLRQRYALDSSSKVLLFVGGLDTAHYFKGVEHLIEAAQYIKKSDQTWRLIVVGSGDLRPKYESLVHQLHLEQRVIFAGHVSQDELPAYYSLADVTVLPSISMSEAFGMVLIESLACGTGVIATNLPGVRSVVRDDVGLLVEPRSVEQLAGALEYALHHPEDVKQWGAHGIQYVSNSYSWKAIGQQLNDIMESL